MKEFLAIDGIIAIVSFAVSVYLIFTFLGQAKNIASIRRTIDVSDSVDLFERARKYEFMRNKEKALEMYLTAIFIEVNSRQMNNVDVLKIEDNLKQRYGDKIKKLGGEWPDFSVFKD